MSTVICKPLYAGNGLDRSIPLSLKVILINTQHTHLGVYGLIIVDNKYLLIKKSRGPYKNLLDLPGGKIEFGETPEQALKREITEETGQCVIKTELLFCDSVRFIHNAADNSSTEDLHHIGIVYNVVIKNGIVLKSNPDGFDSNGAF